MSNASTRRGAYAKVAEEFGVSVGAIKMMASRAGLTSRVHSLQYSFAKKEEEGIVAICIKYARRGEPLTVHDFIELVSRYKKYPKNRRFSRTFVRRHRTSLCMKPGKLTSPTRVSDLRLQQTEEFINKLDPLFERNIINKKNLFVFDETVIGESDVQQLVVGEHRKSGGGNINVFKKRIPALGSFTPFSRCDGTTPFRVFVQRVGKSPKRGRPKRGTVHKEKAVHTADSYRLYLSSKTGYMTKPLFKCIMEHFVKWWNAENPGLHCYLLCDNLNIHINKEVVAFTSARGVNITTIMPGSSHWFQVHDQIPFGTLKKKMADVKNNLSRASSLEPKVMQDFLMGVFSIAESEGLAPSALVKSFEEVGLWPWNPQRIRDLCQKHCPPPSQLSSSRVERKLERIMMEMTAEHDTKRNAITEYGKRVRDGSSENSGRYQLRRRKSDEPQFREDLSSYIFPRDETMSIEAQPPVKRRKTI